MSAAWMPVRAGLKAAAAMLEDGKLEAARDARYAGWDTPEGKALLTSDLDSITAKVLADGIEPRTALGPSGTVGKSGEPLPVIPCSCACSRPSLTWCRAG